MTIEHLQCRYRVIDVPVFYSIFTLTVFRDGIEKRTVKVGGTRTMSSAPASPMERASLASAAHRPPLRARP